PERRGPRLDHARLGRLAERTEQHVLRRQDRAAHLASGVGAGNRRAGRARARVLVEKRDQAFYTFGRQRRIWIQEQNIGTGRPLDADVRRPAETKIASALDERAPAVLLSHERGGTIRALIVDEKTLATD